MTKKIGRNDPCPCGSGKKYKSCCIKFPRGKKPIKATVMSGTPKKAPDLLERTFGEAIRSQQETFSQKGKENLKDQFQDKKSKEESEKEKNAK